jgi:hypothetical protein
MSGRRAFVFAAIAMVIFALSGCASTNQSGASRPQAFFDARNKYIGDNSADMKLLNLVGINEIGKYKIELQTSREPYALKITFSEINAGIDVQKLNSEMEKKSVLLLALIENAGRIEWAYTMNGEEAARSITADEAAELIGKDVKACGESKAGVEELLNKLE